MQLRAPRPDHVPTAPVDGYLSYRGGGRSRQRTWQARIGAIKPGLLLPQVESNNLT